MPDLVGLAGFKSKLNSRLNMPDLVGLSAGFKSKLTETAAGGFPSSKMGNKKMKEEDHVGQEHRSHYADYKRNEEMPSPSKKSQWFFIPLDDNGYHEVPILSYDCHTTIEFTCIPRDESRGEPDLKKTELPSMRLDCRRTVSESSSTSDDDSFICFAEETVHEDSFIWIESEGSLDDSFICFEGGDDDDNDDEEEEEDDDDDVDDDDDSSTTDAEDEVDGEYPDCTPMKLTDSISDDSSTLSESDQSPSEGSSKKKKRVSFVDNSQLVTVHPIVAWDYAYRAARVSQWMEMARDTMRFQRRIQSLEAILSPVLSPEHRASIWESRTLTEE